MRIAVTIVCLAVMVVAVSLFARTIAQIVRTVKLGQPVPLSNLVFDEKFGSAQPPQEKIPARCSPLSGLE